MGIFFPKDDSASKVDPLVQFGGEPVIFIGGGFPEGGEKGEQGDKGKDGKDATGPVFAKIAGYIGNDAYHVRLHRERISYSGELFRATHLHPYDWEPPLLAGQIVIARKTVKGWWYLEGKNLYQGILGEVKGYCGLVANIPTGWLLCNKANNAAGAMNGITPPNLVNRVIIGAGDAADVTPTDANDTTYDLAIGAVGGYNRHGLVGANNVNNHSDHSEHWHAITNFTHTHGYTTGEPSATDTAFVGAATTLADDKHTHTGSTGGSNPATVDTDHTAAWPHGDTDNRMLFVAEGFICFVGV